MSALRVTNLLNKVLTGSGASSPLGQSSHFTVFVNWPTGTSAGSVIIECAPSKDYAGTWSNLTTFTWALANSIDSWRGTGPFGAIRARVGTTITASGDGVSADLWEN